MKFENSLYFVIELLTKLHISSNIISNSKDFMHSKIDLGLRKMLFKEENYAKLLKNSPEDAVPNTIYRFMDEYKCNYIFFEIPKHHKEFFFVGPYLKSLPSNDYISNKSKQLNLSEIQKQELKTYYRNLPIVEDENILLTIIDTLGIFLWGKAENFNVEYINYEIFDKKNPIDNTQLINNDTNNHKLTLDVIEQNYKNEKNLLEAISKGKLNKVDIIVSSVINQGTEERLTDTLRNRKNYLVILNTLLRKAAEYGFVHPYHIHLLSSSFAKDIESLSSIEQSIELQKCMIRKYCLLVKNYSLKNYSRLVGKVITLISYDLTQDLSLKKIATLMNVNASYLSSMFKKECGQTLTDYVTKKRMENAIYLLSYSDKQIQTIAEECGIFDVNYFIKIFKKHYKQTPKQYKNSLVK